MPLMELDTQVEEAPQASAANSEQKHKHKKKDKHKHKHHKKSKRDRQDNLDQDRHPDQKAAVLAQGEVARTGSEDGELPGPPAVEGPIQISASTAHKARDALEPADDTRAGVVQTAGQLLQEPSSKRR